MKKMTSQYNRLSDMMGNINDIISDLEEKRDDIEQNAWGKDRDITEEEQEKLDEISYQICSLYDCVEYIESAMGCLEEYTD